MSEIPIPPWSLSEDVFIITQVNSIGNKWSYISKHLYGRTSNAVKNRYFGHIKRKNLSEDYLVEMLNNQTAQSVFKPVIHNLYTVIN